MSTTMRRRFGDVLLSAGTLVVLLGALASFDPRVREQFNGIVHEAPSSEVSGMGASVRHASSMVVRAVRDYSSEHAALAIFVVAATILVVVMLRI